ncbi:uncharacterized protein LOC121250091 [Juglans microcarpa x Juglans regia]|uniref:uncharacterized protein LOC121250091 n=1 Tax=Juglans microcarpa x Juglans regia TaxID=2249226 RepID=UPI001B7E51EB|nr:uncharacterized protein LOC121250091 [Juglans microcarpa x Juglans regia]
MKKLICKKGQVHPSSPSTSDLLAVLPATILALTAALSAEDKEVLAYLIIISSSINTGTICSNFSGHPEAVIPRRQGSTDQGSADYHSGWADHTPMFQCNCFRCYMSFWARWDASPSRELIHEIIEAYEDDQLVKKKKKRRSAKMKTERKKIASNELKDGDQEGSGNRSAISRAEVGEPVSVDASGSTSTTDGVKVAGDHGTEVGWVVMKESVGKIASFIGEKIWAAGVWIN